MNTITTIENFLNSFPVQKFQASELFVYINGKKSYRKVFLSKKRAENAAQLLRKKLYKYDDIEDIQIGVCDVYVSEKSFKFYNP